MPAKAKKTKGKTVDINTFNEDVVHEDVLDWAEDDWNQSKEDKVAAKIAKYREFSRTEKNAFGAQESFRTAERLQPGMLGNELQPPYVAHFGNIRNGTTDEAFLKLFDEGVVVSHHLISQDGKTFALVEFTTADAMRLALLLDGTFQRARKLYVDLATPKQIERLFQHTGRSTGNSQHNNSSVGPGFSRDSAGQPQPGAPRASSFADLSRDAFGAQQQSSSSFGGGGGGERGSPLVLERSTFGSKMDLHNLDDLSRDVLGSAAQPPARGSIGSNAASSPTAQKAASPTAAFANWRSEEPLPQPRALRDDARPGDASHGGNTATAATTTSSQRPQRRREPMGGAGGAAQPQAAAASFGNWRAEPRAAPPQQQHAPRRDRDDNANRRSSGDGEGDDKATPTARDAAPQRGGGANNNTSERPRGDQKPPQQQQQGAAGADKWASLRR